jgi:hypothetical protein
MLKVYIYSNNSMKFYVIYDQRAGKSSSLRLTCGPFLPLCPFVFLVSWAVVYSFCSLCFGAGLLPKPKNEAASTSETLVLF